MSDVQKTTGGVETTEEVKRLAAVCVAEGKTAAEIEDVSDETRAQLSVYLKSLGGQTESASGKVEPAAQAQEKTLHPEQAEALIDTLRARFESHQPLRRANREVFPNEISWADVEKALRARPDLLWSLNRLEKTGGEPDVLKDEGDAFRFGDFSEESPSGRMNVVFDAQAEAYLRKHYLSESRDGNAADRVAEWGCEFMNEDEYRLLQSLAEVDTQTWSWLRTPANIRRAGRALDGTWDGESVDVSGDDAHDRNGGRGFRCSLRVPKV